MPRLIVITLLCSVFLAACREPQEPLDFQQTLPLSHGVPFDVLVDDVDADGRRDVAVVSHGGNFMQVFFQQENRRFSAGPEIGEVGFHPGMIARWPGEKPRYLLNAEGDGRIRFLGVEPDRKLRLDGELNERSPRYATFFSWPGWGAGLAVSPFVYDTFVLWKNLEFGLNVRSERHAIPLSASGHSNIRAGKPVAGDIDGDGVAEILFTIPRKHEVRVVRLPKDDAKPTADLLYRFNGGAQDQVELLDLNGDGSLDLIVPDQITPFEIHLLINDGHGTFRETGTIKFPTTMGIRSIDVGLDMDGVKTVLAVGYGALVLYRFPPGWDGKSQVPEIVHPFPPYEASQAVVLRDIDADGWLDALVGRGVEKKGVWLAFGPLERHFHTLIDQKFNMP